MTLDMKYFEEMEAKIPKGKVRTRFAPSPTGYMHVGNLRTACLLYTSDYCLYGDRVEFPFPQCTLAPAVEGTPILWVPRSVGEEQGD